MLFFKKSTENSGGAFGAAFLALTLFGLDFTSANTASLLNSARVYPGENNGCNRYPFLSKVDFPSDENAYAIKSGNGFEKGDLICATEDVSVQYTLKDLLESKQVEKSFISDLLNNGVISRDQYDHYVPSSERGWKETVGDDWRLLFSAPTHLGLASDVRLLGETAVGLGLLYGFHRSGLLRKTASGVKSCFVGVKNAISYICCCGCCCKSRKAKDTKKPTVNESGSTDFNNNPTLVEGQINESLDTTEYSTINTEEKKSDVAPSTAKEGVLETTTSSGSSSEDDTEEEPEGSPDDSNVISQLTTMRGENAILKKELEDLRVQLNALQRVLYNEQTSDYEELRKSCKSEEASMASNMPPETQAPVMLSQPQPMQYQFNSGAPTPVIQPLPQMGVPTQVINPDQANAKRNKRVKQKSK